MSEYTLSDKIIFYLSMGFVFGMIFFFIFLIIGSITGFVTWHLEF